MPLAIPNELKPITPFVRRAEELDKDSTRPESRLVAYYCRQYAVRTGIPLSSTSAVAKTCLGQLLEFLEKDKKAMDTFTRPEAEFLCRQFAYGVFDRADGEDRSGMSNKTTAKTFYTSASFLQMLEQFYGEDPTEESKEDKRRALYAKWKATEILKAIKEGRKPVAGGYTEHRDNEEQEEEEGVEVTTSTKNDAPEHEDAPEDEKYTPPPPPPPVVYQPTPPLPPQPPAVATVFDSSDDEEEAVSPPPPAYPGPPPVPPPPPQVPPPPKPPAPAAAPKPPTPKPTGGGSSGWFGGGKKSNATSSQFADATELTKFALAALEERDADLAAQRLQEALAALGRTVAKRGGRSTTPGRITNAHVADAMELTRFAASAIHDHDGDLAVERLEQALHCLGR